MSTIVLFTIHFVINSLKIVMKSWQTLVNSGLNRSTNSTCATHIAHRCLMYSDPQKKTRTEQGIGSKQVNSVFLYLISRNPIPPCDHRSGLQSTLNVTLKSLIYPSPYAMFKCRGSSVEEGKEKLYWNFCPVSILFVVSKASWDRNWVPDPRSIIQAWKTKRKQKIPYI